MDGGATRSGLVRTDVLVGALAAGLSMAAAASALAVSPRFFFTDDYVTYYMPGFREIARLLYEGRFPLLTDRLWNGGALLQEGQFALFNPISLALYAIIGKIDDLRLAAAVFSLANIGIFAGGAYFVGRTIGCSRRHAFLVGLLAPLSDFVFYWAATNWVSILVSMAWLTWAWGFLILTARRRAYAWAAAVMVAMVLVSGWPFADLALLISVLLAADVFLFGGFSASRLAAAAWLAVALAAGGLLAAPALAPLALYDAGAGRPVLFGGWASELAGLLGVGVPNFVTHWGYFTPYEFKVVPQPTVFVAWFAPLALVNANWKTLVGNPTSRLVMLLAATLAALSMFPGAWQFRWMFRLLPYYQFAVLTLSCVALTQADEQGRRWRFGWSSRLVLAEIGLAIVQFMPLAWFYVLAGAAILACAAVAGRLIIRRDLAWTAFAVATSMAAFAGPLILAASAGYPRFPAGGSLLTSAAVPGHDAEGPTRLTIFDGGEIASRGIAAWKAYAPASTSLYARGTNLVGYSNIPRPGFVADLCAGYIGPRCANLASRVTRPIPPTGRSLLDLTATSEVIVEKRADADALVGSVGPGWTLSRGPIGEWRLVRNRSPGLVTYATPGLSASLVHRAPSRVVLDVRNDAPRAGLLVVARAWYPAWRARLNGAWIPAAPLAGALVSAAIPANAHGRLDLVFRPSGLSTGIVLALVGALMLVLTSIAPGLIDVPIGRFARALERRGSKSSFDDESGPTLGFPVDARNVAADDAQS